MTSAGRSSHGAVIRASAHQALEELAGRDPRAHPMELCEVTHRFPDRMIGGQRTRDLVQQVELTVVIRVEPEQVVVAAPEQRRA